MPETLAVMDWLALGSDANGMTIHPIFHGSKYRPDSERASFIGSSENFLPGPFMRALVEGMIEEVALPYFVRTKPNTIRNRCAGNAIRRNAALRAASERRFGHPLRLGRFEEAAAVGAAMLCCKMAKKAKQMAEKVKIASRHEFLRIFMYPHSHELKNIENSERALLLSA